MGRVFNCAVRSLWFSHRRGLAISLALTGASCGGIVITPLLVFLIERFGFAAAMLIATAIMVAVLVPVVIAWVGPPSAIAVQSHDASRAESSSKVDGTSRAKLMGSPAFWALSITFALALIAQIGFIVHQIAMLEPQIGRANAGFAVSVMTFMAIAGRLVLGLVVARTDPRFVAALSLVGQAVALSAILWTDDVSIVLTACALFGVCVGNIVTLPPLIVHREFSAAGFVTILGLANAVSATVGSLGPALVGLIRSRSGSYDAA